MFCSPCILVQSCEQNQIGAQIFVICLLFFSTCFGQLCAHHQEKLPYICDTWYLSLYIGDCLVRDPHTKQFVTFTFYLSANWKFPKCVKLALCYLVNRTNLVHNFFFKYIYCFSLHVSANYVSIIRRNYRTHVTPGICHCIQMTFWNAGWNETLTPCIPDSHLYRVTNTRCRIGTVISPDDGHIVARNMQIKTIHILTLRRRIKSHLLFAGIIRSSPFSPRQQDKG